MLVSSAGDYHVAWAHKSEIDGNSAMSSISVCMLESVYELAASVEVNPTSQLKNGGDWRKLTYKHT